MVGRGKRLKKPEVRDDLTKIGTPKISVSNHGGTRVKLSRWPFCGWIPRSAKAIWTTFDFKRTQSVQHFAGRVEVITLLIGKILIHQSTY